MASHVISINKKRPGVTRTPGRLALASWCVTRASRTALSLATGTFHRPVCGPGPDWQWRRCSWLPSSVLLLPEVLDPQNRGEVHFCEIKVVAVWRVDSCLARGDNGQIIRQASLGRNRSHKTAEEGCVVKKFLVFLGVAIAFMCSSNWVQAETIFALT